MNENKCPFSHLHEPEGIKGIPIFGSALNLAMGQLNFFTRLREKYGDVAKIKLFNKSLYLVSHPDDIASVFKEEKNGVYSREFFTEPVKEYFGEGIFNSYGKKWEKSRKRLQPFFNKNNKQLWYPIILEETLCHLDQIKPSHKGQFNADTFVIPLIQDIMSRILFGLKPDNKSQKNLIQAMGLVGEKSLEHAIKSCFLGGLLNKFPTPSNLKYKEALNIIDRGIKEMGRKGSDGLLHHLISQNLNEKELRDECFNLFFAGQDTTSSTILWTLYFLAKYPDAQTKVRNEILTKCDDFTDLPMNDLSEMKYLDAVVNESMRLIPTFYTTYRDVNEVVELGGKKINSKSLVLLSPYVTHRHPDFWKDPNKFKPERFLSNKKHGFSFFPFGGGQRVCLGSHLAKLEIMTVVICFTASFSYTLDSKSIKKEARALLKPKNGIPLKIMAIRDPI